MGHFLECRFGNYADIVLLVIDCLKESPEEFQRHLSGNTNTIRARSDFSVASS